MRTRDDLSSLLLAKLYADRGHRGHRGQRGNTRWTPLVWPTPPISSAFLRVQPEAAGRQGGRPTGRSNERGAFLRRQNARQPRRIIWPHAAAASAPQRCRRTGFGRLLSLFGLAAWEVDAQEGDSDVVSQAGVPTGSGGVVGGDVVHHAGRRRYDRPDWRSASGTQAERDARQQGLASPPPSIASGTPHTIRPQTLIP